MTPKNSVLIPAIGRHLYLKVDRFAKMSKLQCTKCPAKLLTLFEPRFLVAKRPIKQWLGIFQQPFQRTFQKCFRFCNLTKVYGYFKGFLPPPPVHLGGGINILKKRNFSERGEAELRGLEVLLCTICQCFSTATLLRPRVGCPIIYNFSKKL